MTFPRTSTLFLLPPSLLLGAFAPACASSQSSRLMHTAALIDTTAPPDAALVVFVRDSSPCDGGDPFRVVDDTGRFLGETPPSSKFVVRMQPGRHAFFAWQPHGDLPADKFPDANQVGAIERDLTAGQTYTIEVSLPSEHIRKGCSSYQFVALHAVDDASIADLLQKAEPLTPDVVAGQATVERERADVQAHIDLGSRKLNR